MNLQNPALSRISHAAENISRLERLIEETPPFMYFVETDLLTGQRATFAKRDEEVSEKVALFASEIIHTLRSALDNAYWAIVSPFAKGVGERAKIQFPFCKVEARFENELRTRLADRVGLEFCERLTNLKPFQGNSGNLFLGLVHWMNIKDKHRHLLPVAEFKTLSSEQMQKLVPDFPSGFTNIGLGQNSRDIVWHSPHMIQIVAPPLATRIETRVEVPVEAMFTVEEPPYRGPVIKTLQEMLSATRNAIEVISSPKGPPHP